MRLARSVVAAGVFVASGFLFTPTAAEAAANTSASACLQGFEGPSVIVNSYGGLNLRCGDPTKGILHIDSSHPINEHGADDVHVDRCMNNIVGLGSPVSANPGNAAKRITRPSGGWAQIVWDTGTKDVITMYTSDNNNWAACAAFPN
jgi:hypothetical protein